MISLLLRITMAFLTINSAIGTAPHQHDVQGDDVQEITVHLVFGNHLVSLSISYSLGNEVMDDWTKVINGWLRQLGFLLDLPIHHSLQANGAWSLEMLSWDFS